MTVKNTPAIVKTTISLFFIVVAHSALAVDSISHERWDSLTKQHVISINNGASSEVDYQGLLPKRAELKQYLSDLGAVSQQTFDSWEKNDQLAFLLNAYNAWTVELILTKYPDLDSIKDLGAFFQSPWKKSFIPLLGKTRSLDDIEHKLIRGSDRYNDPRIHFAANCASIGCPALRAEAFIGKRLDSQLDDSTRSFLSDKSRNRLRKGDLEVSSIFKWYEGDFEKGWRGQKNLAQFLASYSKEIGLNKKQVQLLLEGDIDIEFLDYDWALNRTR